MAGKSLTALLGLITLWLIGACAPKIVPTPVVVAPRFPEFMAPTVPAALSASAGAQIQARGWAFLQSGDLTEAEHEFSTALKLAPDFYPAEISFGWLELARKDPKAALVRFDRALGQQPRDTSALVGRGEALLATDRASDAIATFEAAVGVDPGLTEIARRVDVLKFQTQREDLTRARAATRAGRFDEAIRAYTTAIAGSPDSAFLYRELADVERQSGKADAALDHFRKAVALDPADARSMAQIGTILEMQGDLDGAIKSYSDSLAIEPNDDVAARLDAARVRADIARLPAEYHAIDSAPQITRADLAALIGVRLSTLIQNSRRPDAVVITDLRTSWAAAWIMAVARAGVMDPLPNHTFQPRAVVRRVDLAQTVSRLLARVPAQTRPWEAARLRFADLSAGHLAYVAASQSVAAGAITIGDDTAFQPSRPVAGPEAARAIERVAELAGIKIPR